ncbi:MAG: PAS domain-containing sensor histidine kinase [Burkholderiales bacterium]|nr:PAS domain-containing sensor histidine kinase [Anaerolineae bacterium]
MLHISDAQRQKALLDAIFSNSPSGLLLVSIDGVLLETSAAADHMFAQDGALFIEQHVFEMFAAAGCNDEDEDTFIEQLGEKQPFEFSLRAGNKSYKLNSSWLEEMGEWLVFVEDATPAVALSELKARVQRLASHDLKNPLSRIMGYGTLLLDLDDLPEKHHNFVERIVKSSEEMTSMLRSFAALEQLRSEGIQRKPLNFVGLVQAVTQTYLTDMQTKSLTFSSAMPETLPSIFGDQEKLAQAVSHLMHNAITYTKEGGSINLRVSQVKNRARLEIEDNGYGIPESAQGRLFQEFYRVRTPSTAHIGGIGLGLSLVKSVVEAHQGRVWVMSEENAGSTFIMELPIPRS